LENRRSRWEPVTGVAIYVEGGGEQSHGRAAVRQGIGDFLADLRERARRKSLHWKVVACGSRLETKDKFLQARTLEPATLSILLVDAEAAVSTSAKQHLAARDDWALPGVPDEQVHLMVQVMETWIVADRESLREFYRQGFNENALPNHMDLEQVPKATITAALRNATNQTQKGEYHKIRHAHVLAGIRPERVRARCKHCERLFSTIEPLVS
jgi:hypothetical protein